MKLAIWCYGWLLVIGFLALEWSILRYALARHRRGERYSARCAIGDSVCIAALMVHLTVLRFGMHKPVNAAVAMSGATYTALQISTAHSSLAQQWRRERGPARVSRRHDE